MNLKIPLVPLQLYGLLSFLLFLGVESLKYLQVPAPDWVFFYFNDFLVIPIVGLLCLWGVWLLKRNKSIRLRPLHIISLVVLYAIYFEYYLPQHNPRYTGDWRDVCCYIFGGLIFYVLQKIEKHYEIKK